MNNAYFDIHIDTNTLSFENELITGGIWVEIGNESFPEENWNDFTVIILTWWHRALLNLITVSKGKASESFDFMDGPYTVKFTKQSINQIRIQGIKTTDYGKVVCESSDTLINIKSALVDSTKLILDEAHKKNWSSNDLIVLIRLSKELERVCVKL